MNRPKRENLPAELLEQKQFICWREEPRGERLDKIPVAPWATGHNGAASVTDPKNWTTFDEAMKTAEKKDLGIGYVFKQEGGVVGIDLDKCVQEDGRISQQASDIVHEADSFTELSPSGKGIHILMKGILPSVVKTNWLEMYDRDRFFTLTGMRYIETPNTLSEKDEMITRLATEHGRETRVVSTGKAESKVPITTVIDTSMLKKRGKHLQGPHPVHGSEQTGMNFSIDTEKNCWYCYRHLCGGGPLSLLAMKNGITTCEDIAKEGLPRDKMIQALKEGKKLGFEATKQELMTDKFISDEIMGRHDFYCDKMDPNITLYVWRGGCWHNGVAEGMVLFELADIFSEEESRSKMLRDKTTDYIKGTAMRREIEEKPPELISFKNGILDITTMELKPHDKKYFVVNQIPHDYDSAAECPKWMKWLSEVVYEEDICFIQEWMGYNFFSYINEAAFLILIGTGQNSKSLFMDMFMMLMGENNVTSISLADLTYDAFQRPQMQNKLSNISDDIGSTVIKNAGKLKEFSSGSTVEEQRKYGQPFKFKPFAKITYSCNEPPEIKDQSDAIKMRLQSIEFPYTFSKKPKEGEKTARDRKEIMTELVDELPGISNWCIEGLLRLKKNNFTFSVSKSREETWNFYRRKSLPVLSYLEECLEITDDDNDKLTSEEMYTDFLDWLGEKRVKIVITRAKMMKDLRIEGITMRQKRTDDMKRMYYGIVTRRNRFSTTSTPPPSTSSTTIHTFSPPLKNKKNQLRRYSSSGKKDGKGNESEKEAQLGTKQELSKKSCDGVTVSSIREMVGQTFKIRPFKTREATDLFPPECKENVTKALDLMETHGELELVLETRGGPVWRSVASSE